jgi:hypothetical protein
MLLCEVDGSHLNTKRSVEYESETSELTENAQLYSVKFQVLPDDGGNKHL